MDDKRVTVDQGLRERVLDPLVQRHNVSMLDLVHVFVTFAVAKRLDPLPPTRKEVLSGDVFPESTIYRLVEALYQTDEPRRVAHELANAGMAAVASSLSDEVELLDLFEMGA